MVNTQQLDPLIPFDVARAAVMQSFGIDSDAATAWLCFGDGKQFLNAHSLGCASAYEAGSPGWRNIVKIDRERLRRYLPFGTRESRERFRAKNSSLTYRLHKQKTWPIPQATVAPPQKHNGGRPEKYAWPLFENEVAIWVLINGFPEPQSLLESHMADWCECKWKEAPSESTIRTRVTKTITELKRRMEADN